MKFILLSAFLLSCVVQAGAQDKRILDSLGQVLGTKEGLDRYEALHKLAVQYVDVDDERALSISNEAECVALNSLDTFSIVKSKRLKGQILLRLGRNEEVISTCESVLPFGHEGRYSEEWVLILNNFGIAYLYESRFDKALEYLFAGYEIAGTENNPSWRAMSLNNIGITYYKLRDYDRALDFFLRAYDVKKSLGLISLYEPINICLCYVQIGDFGNAQRYLQEVAKNCGPACSDENMVHIKFASGSIRSGLKQTKLAESEFLDSYRYARRAGNVRMQLDNIRMLAGISVEKGLDREALDYLQEGERLIRLGTPFNLETLKIYSLLGKIYMKNEDFEKASYYQSRYIHFKDSIYSEALITGLMKREGEFLERENRAKIAAQKDIISLKEQVIYYSSEADPLIQQADPPW